MPQIAGRTYLALKRHSLDQSKAYPDADFNIFGQFRLREKNYAGKPDWMDFCAKPGNPDRFNATQGWA